MLLFLAAFAVPSLATADSVTGQYKERDWSATGNNPVEPNYGADDGSNGSQTTQSGSTSNSPGTAGTAAEKPSQGDKAKKGGSAGNAPANGSGGKKGAGNNKKNRASAIDRHPTDETVAQVPDAALTAGDSDDGGGGISPLVWVLIAVVALGGVSGVIAMRARRSADPA